MPIHHQVDPEGPFRGEPGVKVTDLGSDHRLVRDGVEQLAHGAMICPACSMPVRIETRISASDQLSCGYCSHQARAHEFLSRDVYDTAGNEVVLVASLP